MQEESYVPIEIHLAYIDSVNSASPQKRAHATALLQRYPQLDAPTPPAHATYRTNTLPDVPEITFEDHYILPTLQGSGIPFLRQHTISIRIGRAAYQGRIDFYLYDDDGILSIIESKRSIPTSFELAEAVAQAKSYALPLGSPSFIIAAPQHIWLYSLERNRENLEKEYSVSQFKRTAKQLRSLLLTYR